MASFSSIFDPNRHCYLANTGGTSILLCANATACCCKDGKNALRGNSLTPDGGRRRCR